MSRSTFSILPYINRQKVKADGTANILCRITVDGKSAAISTGISCTPQEWNAKKGEVRNARDSGRLASFLAEVKDKYNSLLSTNGIITVEMLKAVLMDKDTTGKFLLSFGDTIVEWYRTAKARQTFLHKRTWQKNLRDFVHSLDKDDIAFEDIDKNFGEEYKLFLKRDQGRIDSYVNHCLLWLNMLMYKAVDRSIIRFNPIAKIGYEKKAAPKMTHISKADFIKMLSTPMADERTELARRCFIFASLTSLSYIDVKKLYPHHISENSEGRKFIRKEREKTGVEFFVPLHPIAEKILSLYNTTDDSKPVQSRKDVKAISVRLLGDYKSVNYMEVWNKLGAYCQKHHLDYDCPDAEYINIYHDNPATTPAEACRTDVCIAAPIVEQLQPEEDVNIITIYGGRFLVYRYQGPYENLAEVNAKVYCELLPASGEKVKLGSGVLEHCQMFERYLNDPETTAPEELLTEIWIPIE